MLASGGAGLRHGVSLRYAPLPTLPRAQMHPNPAVPHPMVPHPAVPHPAVPHPAMPRTVPCCGGTPCWEPLSTLAGAARGCWLDGARARPCAPLRPRPPLPPRAAPPSSSRPPSPPSLSRTSSASRTSPRAAGATSSTRTKRARPRRPCSRRASSSPHARASRRHNDFRWRCASGSPHAHGGGGCGPCE
eukprot:7380841-Prymnesium_polylepis.1